MKGKTFFSLVTGIAAGAILGVLLAPEKGSETRLPGIVNCSFPGQDGEKLLLLLNYHGFACSGGAACSSQNAAISHVLTAIGVPEKEAGSSIRISIGSENTEEEIRSFLACLRQLIN